MTACGEPSPSPATPTPTPTTAVGPHRAVQPPSPATPTPTPTPEPIVAICPDGRDHAGVEFTYQSTEQTFDEAVEVHCGTQAPRTAVCPDIYEDAGAEYTFDPDEMTPNEALDASCGTLAPRTAVCPDGYAKGGAEYTFDPDDMTASAALAQNCGRRYERGAWRTGSYSDAVDRSKTTMYAHLSGRWIGIPEWTLDDSPALSIECRSNDGLVIYVTMGGYVGAAYQRGVPVEYSLNGSQFTSQDWSELNSDEGAWLQAWRRADFISKLRTNSTAELVFRIYAFDGTVHGTARFYLTGIELQVEPVFEACGW